MAKRKTAAKTPSGASDESPYQAHEETVDDQEVVEFVSSSNQLTRYIAQFKGYPRLDKESNREMVRLFKKTRSKKLRRPIAHRIAYGNLFLVISVAKKYTWTGIPIIDLIQEGMTAISTIVVPKFDLRRKNAFSTYATWWLKHVMTRYFHDTDPRRMWRLPAYVHEELALLYRAESRFVQAHGRPPDDEELLVSVHAHGTKNALKMTLKKLRKLRKLGQERGDSLDAEVSHGKSDTRKRSEVVGDQKSFDHASIIEAYGDYSKRMEALRKRVAKLNPRAALIVRARLGLEDGEVQTLEELGAKLGVSRERIRQLEEREFKILMKQLKVKWEELKNLPRITEELLRLVHSL